MANINVSKESGEPTGITRRNVWDPFRTMREMMQWDPFRAGSLAAHAGGEVAFAPDFEIKETKDAFEFTADVPGVQQKDLEVSLTNNRLSISGKREAEKKEQNDTYYAYERSYGSFTRTFTVPEGINADAINADLKDGVLKVVLPKKPEARKREVQIRNA